MGNILILKYFNGHIPNKKLKHPKIQGKNAHTSSQYSTIFHALNSNPKAKSQKLKFGVQCTHRHSVHGSCMQMNK